ncbi:MAG: murein hydrolase activator EnvC [Gemmatimonadota bacterium]
MRSRRLRRRAGFAWLLAAVAACVSHTAAIGQDPEEISRQLQESQGRLDQIRRERSALQTQLNDLGGQVHDVSSEIVNIERQIAASASAMVELDVQIGALLDQVTIMTRDMLLNRDRLTARKAVLRHRLREIYKRGPLATFQVLLSSRSFANLINRYRYLHDISMFDRLLVREVQDLETELEVQRGQLATESDRIQQTRDDRMAELDQLARLEQQRQRRLRNYTSQQSQTESRLTQLAAEEEQLRGMITTLETRRREAERTVGISSTPTLTTSDLGRLDWPVEGEILYGFGPQSDGATTIFREGVGIAAPRGTPVRSINAGSVVFAGPRTSGQTVIVDHGGGYYSVYTRLQSLTVLEGQAVQLGQMIGRVGGEADSPHIELQIYEPSAGGPRVVDPVRWLRDRG